MSGIFPKATFLVNDIFTPALSSPQLISRAAFIVCTFQGLCEFLYLFPLDKNGHNMGLTNNPNECIEEVDVIFAGGTSYLLWSLYM